jgi:CzcA family heavy metal efflux pump
MLQAIVNWSIRNRFAVLVLAAVLMGTGTYATGRARLDVFPEFAQPQVIVQTEAPGLAPEQVEQLITQPIENAVNGVPRLDVLRSESIQGLSAVTAVFQDGTDVYRARQQISERLAQLAGQFPPEVKRPPRMAPLTSTTGRLLTVGFTSDKLSPMELRDRVQWNIRPRLLAVRGVAQVTMFGGDVRQFQVQLNPDALAARNLTVSDIMEATRQASGISAAGFQQNPNQRIVLRVEGQVFSARELAATVVAASEGTPIRLGDVAYVTEGPEAKFGDSALNDSLVEATDRRGQNEPCVLLVIYKQIDDDTREVTRRVEAELQGLEPILKGQDITYHPGLFRQANFIEHAVGNVAESLVIGAILVAVVLFVFLFNVRTAFISLTAIPLSLLTAVALLWAYGVGLNTLTIGGLAIAIGEVVDDAIIDVENIYRRLRENARLEQPRSVLAVVLSASLEVRTAVVYATFIVVLVFVPIFFLSGLHGRLFAPLGYAYVLAVLASLVVALTVTPALSLLLLRVPVGASPDHGEPWLLRRLQADYVWLLRRLDRELVLVATVVVVLVAGTVWALRDTGGEFLPELRENHFVVHMRGLPGTSLQHSMAGGNRVTQLIRGDPDLSKQVRSLAQEAGRAELGEDTTGVETGEIEVDLWSASGKDAARLQKQLNQTLTQGCVGFSFEVLPFLKERINETLSGTGAAVAIKVYGDRLDLLDEAAQRIARALGTIHVKRTTKAPDGNTALQEVSAFMNILVEPQTGAPELVVRPRWEDAARLGLRNVQILDAMHTAFQGAEIAPVYDRNRVIDMTVLLAPRERNDPEAVGNLWLSLPPAGRKSETSSGDPGENRVQLKQVADVYLSDGRFLIAHECGLRRQQVTCNIGEDLDKEGLVAEAERRVREVKLPPGVSYVFAGEHEASRAARRELWLLGTAALIGILLLLWMVFQSLRRLLLILVNLPFALVGGVAAVYLGGGNLNVGSLVGFVTLFGITMRNGIMMVSHWQHLHEVEGMPWGPELVFRGARERLAPVLMTALVTGLGLLPIALGSGEAGREIEGPMAQVILGGLVTSTALNLLVLPVLYRHFGYREMPPVAGTVVGELS